MVDAKVKNVEICHSRLPENAFVSTITAKMSFKNSSARHTFLIYLMTSYYNCTKIAQKLHENCTKIENKLSSRGF